MVLQDLVSTKPPFFVEKAFCPISDGSKNRKRSPEGEVGCNVRSLKQTDKNCDGLCGFSNFLNLRRGFESSSRTSITLQRRT